MHTQNMFVGSTSQETSNSILWV